MPTVTGNVSTFGLESVSLAGAAIQFIPSQPAITGDRYVLSARTVSAPIAAGSGAFTVNLATTETTRPATYYSIRIVSLDPGENFTHIDFPEWELRVPVTGGPIADLLVLSANPAMAWVGDDPPPGDIVPGAWWLDSDSSSDDFGWLLEWE
jgi:hypothetical protein